MINRMTHLILGVCLAALPATPAIQPAQAQLAVLDPTNLIQNTLNATRALQQIQNQVKQITNQLLQLENEARNLTRLNKTFAPEIMKQLGEIDALINAATGLALEVNETRDALEHLYSGDYRKTDAGARALSAVQQLDNARSALQSALLMQAKATEQLRDDQTILTSLAGASANATGALSAQQATNEFLAFQVQQNMRLQALLVAQSRAEAMEQARELEALARARVQHEHFFGTATSAHPAKAPWN